MTRVHPAGSSRRRGARRAPDAIDYRFLMQFGSGVTIERGDPYHFGQVITDFDLHLFGEGTHLHAYDKLGAHVVRWATRGRALRRVGPVGAARERHRRLQRVGRPRARDAQPAAEWHLGDLRSRPRAGERYKFEVRTRAGHLLEKADPFAFFSEVPPRTASIVHQLNGYEWKDDEWMGSAGRRLVVRAADRHLRGAPRIVAPER
jgi:1,4-alpha-glucan branching enzyme